MENLAAALRSYARSATEDARRLRRAGKDGPWVGEAADAFRAKLTELPDGLERGVDAFLAASTALQDYAEAMRAGQRQTANAIELAQHAERQHAAWQTDVETYNQAVRAGATPAYRPPETSPAAETMAEARALAERARGPYEDAAAKAVAALNEGAAAAPTRPTFGDVIRYTWEANKRSLAGTAEATYQLGEFGFKSTVLYGLIDPDGAVEHWTSLAGGLAWGVTHPVEFGKAIVDWETWKTDPFRAMGRLVPDIALGAATGGAGAAAVRSAAAARRAAQAAKTAEEAADAARTADRLTPDRPLGNQPDGSWTGEEHGVPFRLDPDANAAVERFLHRAADAEPRITREVHSIIKRNEHSQPEGLDKSLKTEESLKRKIATLLESDRNLDPDQALSRTRDAVRYTMTTPPDHYARAVQHAVRDLEARGFENVKFPHPCSCLG